MRKKLLSFVLVSLLSSAGMALAQDEDEAVAAPEMQQIQRMQARMQAMHAQMQAIQATEDPEERRRLMQEHMQSMHEGMMMMGEMMRGPMGGASMPQCEAGDSECRMNRMQMQQQMMGQRMGMMHQMMQQMTEHMMQQQVVEGAPVEEDHEEHH